jgi:hypothetical protein
MVAHRAFSVDDAVLMLKNRSRHGENGRARIKNVQRKEAAAKKVKRTPA